jgi:beta-lactamase superfamily II metal-dependent hydrolase
MSTLKFIAGDTAKLYLADSGSKARLELLWGDQARVLEAGAARSKVRARGKTGWVDNAALGDTSLLEVYIIDVGQGDGLLIRTPDGRHLMIDGGYKRAAQPSGKNAADFVDWKFAKDYGLDTIKLDAMIASHCDADHYGGLADLLDVAQTAELDAQKLQVEAFYHAGVGWWTNPANGQRWLGATSADKQWLTQLMGSRSQILAALRPQAQPRLQGEWAEFIAHACKARNAAGKPTTIRRLSHKDGHLPGFDGGGGGVAIKVLGPFEGRADNKPALHSFGSAASKNTNGNSLLLRLDYGRARILLTGDLNTESQRALLDDYAGRRIEFQCDVAKACHHGSDDVSYEFLAAMRPAVTVISSGDSEGHDHPRPAIVAASATTGYLQVEKDHIVTPLVYSTEIARSIQLGKPQRLVTADHVHEQAELGKISIEASVTKPGDLNPSKLTRKLDNTLIVAGLIYGLVNIRSDGETILCATLNEKDHSWQVRKFKSRF